MNMKSALFFDEFRASQYVPFALNLIAVITILLFVVFSESEGHAPTHILARKLAALNINAVDDTAYVSVIEIVPLSRTLEKV